MKNSPSRPILWIIVPCYDEQEVLPVTAPLFRKELQELIDSGRVSSDSRILFVNDGSKDDTWKIVTKLTGEDEHYIGIALSRNRGHQNVVLAGLMEAKDRCDITISIDCDGQDDISAMGAMVDKYLNGCEIVYGVRSSREADSWFKRTSAQGYYRFLNRMGCEVVYNCADYRLVSSRVLQSFADFKEVNLFLRGMFPLVGFKSTSVYYERHERMAGKSHYPLRKMLSLAVDGVTSPVYQADLDHRGDRHRSEPSRINRDRLGDRDGSARKRGGWMGFDCVHHVLLERRSATEPRDHRRVRRESVHGVEAQASVHHQ